RSNLALILGVLKQYRSAEESDDPYTMHLWSQIDPIVVVARGLKSLIALISILALLTEVMSTAILDGVIFAGVVAKRQALPSTMGSICDHKCIVYGSSDSSAERYRLSTPSIRAKSLLLFSFFVQRPKCDLENVAYNSCLLATTLIFAGTTLLGHGWQLCVMKSKADVYGLSSRIAQYMSEPASFA
ncbi:hypothetical protein PROFUN_17027, partial [Planoprotostelium fungivorum]